jgi:co-chaperonin GroES (HSP10)
VETQFAEQDFQLNVQPGDELYFNYQTLLDETNCVEHEGKEYWGVEYFQAIAVVRDGKIIPVGSYILIEKLDEDVNHSFLIIPEIAKKKETNRGIVFSSNMAEIPAGSIVEFDPIGKFENEINGKKLYCMYNSNIYFKYN